MAGYVALGEAHGGARQALGLCLEESQIEEGSEIKCIRLSLKREGSVRIAVASTTNIA